MDQIHPVQRSTARCVVLGGGGVVGIGWEIGVAAGLARCGMSLQAAEHFVGTSAGAVAGALLASGADLEALFDAQRQPASDSAERVRPYSQADADAQNRRLVEKVGGDLRSARQRIGAFALRSETPSLQERHAIVAARLGGKDWPDTPLDLVAVDVETGDPRVFRSGEGVSLVDAVAASCAVPGVWPAVPIGGARYMDGGIASMTNAHLARGFARVLVLAPLGYSEGNPVSGHLAEEVRLLEETGSTVQVVVPDADALQAMGPNVLDPARRPMAAEAGMIQGQQRAAEWTGWWRGA